MALQDHCISPARDQITVVALRCVLARRTLEMQHGRASGSVESHWVSRVLREKVRSRLRKVSRLPTYSRTEKKASTPLTTRFVKLMGCLHLELRNHHSPGWWDHKLEVNETPRFCQWPLHCMAPDSNKQGDVTDSAPKPTLIYIEFILKLKIQGCENCETT